MLVTIYMGMSLDGFLARPDDGLDFLPSPPEAGDLGFPSFLATVDVVLMGRRTYEVVRRFPNEAWPYGTTPMVILSRSAERSALLAGAPDTVSVTSGEPAAVLRELEAKGYRHVYVDGAATARSYLAAGLVARLVVTHVPVLIGSGISLWGPLPHDVKLELDESRVHPGGLVQSSYRVLREQA